MNTHRWTEIFSKSDLRKLFGYKYVHSVKLADERLVAIGHDNGVTVLTRLPVEKFETIRIFSRNAIKTTLVDLDIFTTYLDDLSEDTRLKQIDALFSRVVPNRQTIIIGDLNTIDKFDSTAVQGQITQLLVKHPEARAMETALMDMMRGEVTRRIRQSGFIDMGLGQGNTVPSHLFPIQIDKPIARLDYGFCTSGIRIEKFEVLRDPKFDQLSDHYPILMSLRLDS